MTKNSGAERHPELVSGSPVSYFIRGSFRNIDFSWVLVPSSVLLSLGQSKMVKTPEIISL
ncbi:MAG: hypothetical protein WB492_04730 [Christiangramia sp.]